jgi:nucleoside-triphosphatase
MAGAQGSIVPNCRAGRAGPSAAAGASGRWTRREVCTLPVSAAILRDVTGPRLLVTGPPGVGKTTVMVRLARALSGLKLSGFLTEEMRERGERLGFRAMPLAAGEPRTIAHASFPAPRVGRYGVDVAAIDAISDLALAGSPEVDLHLIDEVGRMECLSPRFVVRLRELLAAGAPLIATVAARGSGLIEEVKRRPDVEIFEVTRADRDGLPARLAARVTNAGRSPA